jgi:palmitoyltransferase
MLNGPRSGAVKVTRWCGTQEGTCIWLNTTDYIGVIFSALVWLLLCFAFLTVLRMYDTDLFGDHGTKHRTITMPDFVALSILFTMSCWSYFATMLGDPGSVPWNAHPLTADRKVPGAKFSICGHCDSYKPPGAHHDRVSGRCISRMDHFW